jgi:hypothetical protein
VTGRTLNLSQAAPLIKIITTRSTEKIMNALNCIAGTGQAGRQQGIPAKAIEMAVAGAIKRGFKPGCSVAIGAIAGKIVGFNIAAFGNYAGAHFPLLVVTGFGLAKCAPDELRLLEPTVDGQPFVI